MSERDATIGPAGRYRHVLDLGSGGMAKVWLALRSGPAGFRKLMVVKELREHFAEQPAFRNMFLEEARLAARLQHPNIVQTVEVGEEDDRYFLVMEYLDGPSLQAVIERRQLPVPMALSVMCAALSGLHAAHEWKDFDETVLSVVHRDVSPHNILLTYDGQVKVVDFGIAKTVHSGANLTQAGTFRGKVSYVAPEQARGETVDRRADIFAAGVVLFELLTGRRMWGDLPDVAVLHRLDAGPIPSPRAIFPDVPVELDRICARALARDRDERYATAAELRDDLAAYLASVGQKADSAELGPYLHTLFAEDRRRTRELIQRRLERASTPAPAPPRPSPRSSSLPPVRPPALPPPARTKSGTIRKVAPVPPRHGGQLPSFPEPQTRPMPAPPVLPPPYRVVKLLKRSAHGEIYEAVHSGLERRVIVKTLPDVADEAALLRQARALAALHHPCAARILEAGMRLDAGRGAFVVREHVDGTPLSTLLSAKGRLGVALTIRLGAQLLSALSAAHERGLVHGQLGPAHMLVRRGLDRERLVVIDFVGIGDGPLVARPERQGLAPELARGEPATPSSDLYAAGALLHRCLTGSPALEHEAVRAFFVRALAETPEARFESAKEMLRALLALPIAELVEGDEPGATPFDPLVEPWIAAGRSATTTSSVLRARIHATRSDERPTLWVLAGDPAIRSESVRAALEALEEEMIVVSLDEAARAKALEALEAGRCELPWVVLFGDLHVLLGEPLLAKLGSSGDISRVLVSTHANVELLQSTINACGLDQQVCMPFEPAALVHAIREMANRSAALHRHYDTLRLRLRELREQASALNRSITTVPHA